MSYGTAASGGVTAPAVWDDTELAQSTFRRVSLRLMPFLFILYICNWIDRENVSIAALQMNDDLGLSAGAYGFGAGIFFLGYVLFEVPSNLILARVGARRWIARIMVTWGLIASAMTLMRTPLQFYTLRLLLGFAEAGFFPGVLYYLSQWFPASQRARAIARFMAAIPIAGALGSPLGGLILGLDGRLGLRGWQWLFLVEGIPSVLLGFTVLAFLTDQPAHARWLSETQRAWLIERLRQDREDSSAVHGLAPLRALTHPLVWLTALPYILLTTAAYAYVFWAPILVRDALKTSNLRTAIIVGAISCVSAVGMLLYGANSDRTGERCLHACAAAALVGLGCIGAAMLPTPIARVAALAVLRLGDRCFVVPFWCLPSMLLRGSAAAAGLALINSFGNIGGFVGPYFIGLLRNTTGGMTGALLTLAVMALIGAWLLLVVRRQPVFGPSRAASDREPA
jgi:ACS family tartrate transporter-like MFS transporter